MNAMAGRLPLALLVACSTYGAQAQSPGPGADAVRTSGAGRAPDAPVLEEVVTTATKKSEAEVAQFVPAAINVLTGEGLAARHVTDIEDLSYALPNVALDAIGTGKGIANFSIRGLGVAGSIPSIDPTVGVFVDGMYLGINYGVIVDMLDLEAVDILRGPQGLLFGRNVTGGAVLLRSRRPGGDSPQTLRCDWRLGWTADSPAASRAHWPTVRSARDCLSVFVTTAVGLRTALPAAVRSAPK